MDKNYKVKVNSDVGRIENAKSNLTEIKSNIRV